MTEFLYYAPKDGGTKAYFVLHAEDSGSASYAELYCIEVDDGSKEAVLDVALDGNAFFQVDDVPVSEGMFPPLAEIYVDLADTVYEQKFPGVEKLIIGEKVKGVKVLNTTFPDAREVESHSPSFQSGGCLVENTPLGPQLKNAFCRKAGEEIDLAGVAWIEGRALMGCKSGNFLNARDIRPGSNSAFGDGYEPEWGDGNIIVGSTLVHADPDAETLYVPKEVTEAIYSAFDDAKFTAICFEEPHSLMVVCCMRGRKDITVKLGCAGGPDWMGAYYHAKFIRNNPQISRIEMADGDTRYASHDGIVYTKDGKKLLRCPVGRSGSIEVAPGTEEIDIYALNRCGITQVKLPDSLTNIGKGAFNQCPIKEITIPANVGYVGPDNFLNATHIRQDGRGPVKGLLKSCMLVLPAKAQSDRASGHAVILEACGEKFALPSEALECKACDAISAWDNGEITDELRFGAFKFAQNIPLMEDTALAAMAVDPGNAEAYRFLQENAGKMQERYAKTNDAENLGLMRQFGLIG